jgi:hypothetical protein
MKELPLKSAFLALRLPFGGSPKRECASRQCRHSPARAAWPMRRAAMELPMRPVPAMPMFMFFSIQKDIKHGLLPVGSGT